MIRRTGAVFAAAAVLAACSGNTSLPGAVDVAVTAPPTTAGTAFPTCSAAQQAEDATRSYPAMSPLPQPNEMPAGSTMAKIAEHGKLVVGVSADTLLFGSRNPFTTKIEGFDIDILKEIALAIFGGTYDDIDQHIDYRVITYAQRLPSLESGDVDVVAHTMTINCNRWLRIAFSTKYFDAGQRVLVKLGSGFQSIADLDAAGARVCAPEGSTNIDLLRNDPTDYGRIKLVAKPDITDCLVALQQGEADGLTGDDTVLAGLKAQDPNTDVVGERFTSEPYGLGFNKDAVDFVQFANAVLENVRSNGRWEQIYATWHLADILKPADPPAPTYGRPLP